MIGNFDRFAADFISNIGESSTCLTSPLGDVDVSLVMILSGVTPMDFASDSREFSTFMAALCPMQSWNRIGLLSRYAILGASKIGDTGFDTSTRFPSFRNWSINSLNPNVVPPVWRTLHVTYSISRRVKYLLTQSGIPSRRYISGMLKY